MIRSSCFFVLLLGLCSPLFGEDLSDYNYTIVYNLRRDSLVYYAAVWDKALAMARPEIQEDFIYIDLVYWHFHLMNVAEQSGESATYDRTTNRLLKDTHIRCNRKHDYGWDEVRISHLGDFEMFFFVWGPTDIDDDGGQSRVLGLATNISGRLHKNRDLMLTITLDHLSSLNVTTEELELVDKKAIPRNLDQTRFWKCTRPFAIAEDLFTDEFAGHDVTMGLMALILAIAVGGGYASKRFNNNRVHFLM